MTCFVCGKDSTDYKLERYSPLGFDADENLCRECVYSAIPKLKELEDGERERERKFQEFREAQDTAMAYLRDSPTPQEYKRRKQEMIDKGFRL